MQIFNVLVSEYGVAYPIATKIVSSAFDFVNLDVFRFIRIGCKANIVNQFDRWVFALLRARRRCCMR
jgi:hypothetical protein